MWNRLIAIYMIALPLIVGFMTYQWLTTRWKYQEAMSYYEAARERLESDVRTRTHKIDPIFSCRLKH